MRFMALLALALVTGQTATAVEPDPHDGLYRMQTCFNPNLSYEVREKGEKGSITAIFDIDDEGFVSNIRIKEPKRDHGMTQYVTNALRRWHYFAYLVNGHETKRTDVSLTFTYGKAGKLTCTHTPLPDGPRAAANQAKAEAH